MIRCIELARLRVELAHNVDGNQTQKCEDLEHGEKANSRKKTERKRKPKRREEGRARVTAKVCGMMHYSIVQWLVQYYEAYLAY